MISTSVSLILFLSQICANSATDGLTSKDFVIIGDKEYYFSPPGVQVDAFEARAACGELGKQLISFQTEHKYETVVTYILENGLNPNYFWTSGERFDTFSWRWSSTGELFDYSSWCINRYEPNYFGPEPNVCVWFNVACGWWDDGCSELRAFICD